MVREKVEIEITEGELSDGTPTVFVNHTAHNYGGGSPCKNGEGVQRAIEWAKASIKKEGDIPVIRDKREKAKLTRWLRW